MKSEILLGVVRSILMLGAGTLIAKGYTDQATVEAVAGALVAIILAVISARAKVKLAQKVEDKLTNVQAEKREPATPKPTGTTIVSIILALAIPTSLLTACKTPEQGAYQIAGSTAAIVDTTMNAWGDYVRSGKATDADQVIARGLYEKYQAAMRVAKTTVITLKNTPSDQATWLKVTTVIDNAANDLIAFIGKFIPEIQPRTP